VISSAQVPDLLNAFDAGGRSMGMAGALNGTEPSTLSTYYNPASLAFIRSCETSVTFRNLPGSNTSVSGSNTSPIYSTRETTGAFGLTHIGFAVPTSDFIKHGQGTFGISYTVGGYIDDLMSGPTAGFSYNGLNIQNYQLQREARADYISLGYGVANKSQTASLGLGVTYVDQQIQYNETGTDSTGTFTPTSIDYTGHGVGFLVGGQVIPAKMPNVSIGTSLRSPISMSSSGYGDVYDRVPARYLLAASYRKDNFAGGEDFLLLGAQFQYFFDGQESLAFDRNDQTDVGFGAEYDHTFSSIRIPIRVGYDAVSAGGIGFENANAVTYGFGIHPVDNRFSIDFNWASPEHGGMDFGVNATYHFKP
jgi:hypothetical protein